MELTIKITSQERGKFNTSIKAEGHSAELSMAIVEGIPFAINSILDDLKGSTKESREFTVNALIRELRAKVLGIQDKKSDLDVILGGLQGLLDQIVNGKKF